MGIINSNGLGHVFEFHQTCVVDNFIVLKRDLISNRKKDKLNLASRNLAWKQLVVLDSSIDWRSKYAYRAPVNACGFRPFVPVSVVSICAYMQLTFDSVLSQNIKFYLLKYCAYHLNKVLTA